MKNGGKNKSVVYNFVQYIQYIYNFFHLFSVKLYIYLSKNAQYI